MTGLRAICVVMILALTGAAMAQVEIVPATAPTTDPTTAPTTEPTTRATTGPATTQAIIEARLQDGGIILNFKDAAIDAVLDQLSEVAGFVVVKEVKPEGRITLLSRQPVSREEAVALLNSVLKTNGYTAIQMGRILKVVSREKAKRSNIPVRSGNDPLKIAPTDEMITQVIPIKSADAQQLKNDLSSLIGPDAEISANASSNTLILTDSAANIRRIVEIIAALDSPLTDSSVVKVFKLQFASAANAARLINEVFRQDQQGQGGGGGLAAMFGRGGGGRGGFVFPGMGGPGGPGGGGGNAGGDTRRLIRVNASSDDRTNTLVVTAPQDTLQVIAQVVKELDADPSESTSVFIYPLKNGTAKKLESVVNSLFNGTASTYRPTSGGGQTSTRTPFSMTGSSMGSGGSSSGGGRSGTSGSSFGGSSGGSSFSSSGGSRGGGTFGGSSGFGGGSSSAARSAADLSGQVYVVADEDTNSLLVMTSPKNFERVKQVIADLDRAVPQVLIKVLIAEVSHDDTRELGAEFSVLNLRANGLGSTAGTNFGLAAQNSGLVVKTLEDNITATIRALDRNGKLDVLSRPYILASDNQLASIMVGQSVPFVTDTRISDTGQTLNTIRYQDIGIILNVTPHINPDGLVIMDVNPEISQLTDTTVPISETVAATVFSKRSAQSRVGVRDGQTIVIGGLMEDRKADTLQKVPLLGDIPLIGLAFRSKKTVTSKTELLIFLTPHVAPQPEALTNISKEEQKNSKLVPNAVEKGIFEEHMKAMRGASPDGEPKAPPTTQSAP